MTNQYDKYLQIARNIAYDAGSILEKRFYEVLDKKIDTRLKSPEQLVTSVDLEVNKFIEEQLIRYTPNIPILSEEGAKNINKDQLYWIVDPLDGTTNFVSQSSFFNTTIALAQGSQVLVGVVYAPLFNQMYYASYKNGAFLNGKKLNKLSELKTNSRVHGFCYGSKDSKYFELAANYYRKMLLKGYSIRQFGAAALELSRVATGVLASMYIPGANAWDIAAGALIVKEAGGIVLASDFAKWNLNKDGIVAGRLDIINNLKPIILQK